MENGRVRSRDGALTGDGCRKRRNKQLLVILFLLLMIETQVAHNE